LSAINCLKQRKDPASEILVESLHATALSVESSQFELFKKVTHVESYKHPLDLCQAKTRRESIQ